MDKRKVPANDTVKAAVLPLPSDDASSFLGDQPSPHPSPRSPIDLRIQGDEVFLSGSFHRWQASAASGPDLDLVSIHMAVDTTSPDTLVAHPREHQLFFFASKELRKLGDNVFNAEGVLKTDAGEQPCDVLVEIPEGHTAFVALAFVVKKQFLGDAWQEITGVAGAGGIDAERMLDPRAGLGGMELARA